ncbi:hypothetical protein OTU49_017142 [Cherax quadricarinatus]|uniref:Uncharacterized protein n=1 Tax=Cherax quadricarinatus TaxID=27406 RepID=A0AAW0Y1Q2_CHEQU
MIHIYCIGNMHYLSYVGCPRCHVGRRVARVGAAISPSSPTPLMTAVLSSPNTCHGGTGRPLLEVGSHIPRGAASPPSSHQYGSNSEGGWAKADPTGPTRPTPTKAASGASPKQPQKPGERASNTLLPLRQPREPGERSVKHPSHRGSLRSLVSVVSNTPPTKATSGA